MCSQIGRDLRSIYESASEMNAVKLGSFIHGLWAQYFIENLCNNKTLIRQDTHHPTQGRFFLDLDWILNFKEFFTCLKVWNNSNNYHIIEFLIQKMLLYFILWWFDDISTTFIYIWFRQNRKYAAKNAI